RVAGGKAIPAGSIMNTRLSTPSLNLGVIGNAAAAALVDENASIVWMCSPRMDGDPIFCSLLGSAEGGEGVWSIDMDKRVASVQAYVRNTAILETVFADENGNR